MAFKLNSIGQIEKTYAFDDAVIETEMLNGTIGDVVDGVFEPSANASKAIMQVEVGDDAGMDEYKIPAGSHVRIVDFESLVEQFPKNTTIEIYGAQLPDTYVVGDKLASDANGKLVPGATAAPYFEVTKIIGNKLGVEATMVMA